MLSKKVKQKSEVSLKIKSRAGQALTEFVLGLMIIISLFFFFIKMSATFAIGNFIHYATFMSARAYMSSAANIETQQGNAEKVLKEMVGGRWKSIIKVDTAASGNVPGGYVGTGDIANSNPDNNWNQGVTYSYTSKLSAFPWNKDQQSIELKLTSESWMPREESAAECNQTKDQIKGNLGTNSGVNNITVEWDNGC